VPLIAAAVLALGGEARAAWGQTCVQAQIGTEQAYSCLNDAFARLAGGAHTAPANGVLSAGSPAPAVGTFDQAATAERMGNAFGHSVIAQRPPPPVFALPFTGPAR
jgi:hypothetical protein